MKPRCRAFVANARIALDDEQLHAAVVRTTERFVASRQRTVDAFPDFEQLRERAAAIRDQVLAHLAHYLEQLETRVTENGGLVHWARDGAEASRLVTEICRNAGARRVTKSKSMVTEEIGLNDALGDAGIEVTETDLGEYIIQLAGEHPSHIIAPAIHRNRHQVEELFRARHGELGDRPLDSVSALVDEARAVLRQRFLAADVGITGANFLIAETGSAVVVTNEGNADLTANLPRVHIIIATIEKVLPTLEDASILVRLLARSATGQETSVYTTFFTGPRREGDPDGPDELHLVLLDNGRSEVLGSELQPMLRCIRCAACLNHCPVYNAVGGHAYGWVYPGPMGSVLTPLLLGLDQARHLPNASSLCGACSGVCPVKIPLPELLRKHRERQHEERLEPVRWRLGLKAWGWLAAHPRLYRAVTAVICRCLALMAGRRGRLRMPLMDRDLPAPEARTFMSQWRQRQVRR
jgi:L-lactate dehydrogenase complex protein LldF